MMEKLNVKVELKGELLEKFLKIKETLGLKNNTEVIRILISKFSEV